jgi:hypothetical protein
MSDILAAVSYGNEHLRDRSRLIPWIWEGMIAENAISLLSAPEKTGKTTLLSLLLDRRRQGGQLLGTTVWPGRTILCSEEHDQLWVLRQPPLDFGPQLEFHHPMGSPTRAAWRRFIDHLLELPDDDDSGAPYFNPLVIDTAMSFLPAALNNPRRVRWALQELRVVAGLPAGVLLLHQSGVARNRVGGKARGPLAALADILIDMHVPRGDPSTRRRHFHGRGRYPATLQHVVAELNADGTDYLLLPPPTDAGMANLGAGIAEVSAAGRDHVAHTRVAPSLYILRTLLSQSPTPLTRQEILTRWPATEPPPHPDSLWRMLMRGCQLGLFLRTGAGNKTEAFRYALAASQPAA